MSYQLVKSSQVRVDLSVNVITRKNDQERLITWNLVQLTGLIFSIYIIFQFLNTQTIWIEQVSEGLLNVCMIFYLVTDIVIKSISYGLK